MNYQNKQPVIQMKQIVKKFSGVQALTDITFDLYKGEIHCLVGENGAGKSTLMKVLSGAYRPDGGVILVEGKEYKALAPNLSKELGITIVYQENDLVPTTNVVENIYVGNEKTKALGFMDFKTMARETQELMDGLGIQLDLQTPIEKLSVSDQQFVKILKALSANPKILIMDEPTSMFNVEDAGKVLELARRIAAKGISIIYISHFLKEVQQIADRITVIRDGSVIRTYNNAERQVTLEEITRDMVGRPVDMFYSKESSEIGGVMFEVRGLKLKQDSPEINFTVRKGEILGLSGIVGSGRTEIVRAITGADKKYAGHVYINGDEIKIESPADGIKAGIAHITEDRQRLGLSLSASVLENMLLVGLYQKIKSKLISLKKMPPLVEGIVEDLNIKTPSVMQPVLYLSGGNQQKVVLGKWLFADQTVYVFDEPTRGIDVNAKVEFYKQMSMLTHQGKCIIMISSDMPELISMSDRVLVIKDSAITDELQKDQISEENIITRALGVN